MWLLVPLAAQGAPPRHALWAGAAGGVDLFHTEAPRVVVPSPALGWTVDPAGPGGPWLGLRTAPLLVFVRSQTQDEDVVQTTETMSLLLADVGWELGRDALGVSPFAAVGLSAIEVGARVRWVPARIGPELRLAWHAPAGISVGAACTFGLSRER